MTLCIFFLPLCGQGTISIVAHTIAYISIVTYMTTFVYCDALIIDNTSAHVWDPMEVVFLGGTNFENIEPRAPHWRIFISVYKSLFLSLMVAETSSRTLLTNSTINLEICISLKTTFPSLR